MAFKDWFEGATEKVGSSASKFAKGVADNSKKVAAKAKLKKAVYDLESAKKSAYMEMGKLYFTANAASAEEPYAEWVQKIVEADEKIAQCQKAMAALENAAICDACGTVVGNDQKFCPNCGAKCEPVSTEEVTGDVVDAAEEALEEAEDAIEAIVEEAEEAIEEEKEETEA